MDPGYESFETVRFKREIASVRDMVRAINEMGFLPFFKNDIPGFSVEEMTSPGIWFSDDVPGPWEWKGRVIKAAGCGYGKFLYGKAMFVSRRLFPDFANVRRDGYDFDALFRDGLASLKEKKLYESLDRLSPVLSNSLKEESGFGKGGIKGYETTITRLEMKGYALVCDFEKRRDREGKEYGWAIGRLSTPEKFFGEYFCENVYSLTPEQSAEKLVSHLSRVLAERTSDQIEKIVRG